MPQSSGPDLPLLGGTDGPSVAQQASTAAKPTPSSPKRRTAYFDGCRGRIDGFVDRNFSVAGSARLHGHAVGWDLLKAPANVALSIPQIGLKLSAAPPAASAPPRRAERPRRPQPVPRHRRRPRAALAADDRPPAPARHRRRPRSPPPTRWPRPSSPTRASSRSSSRPATAAADPAFRTRLESALAEYTGTRAAAAEITTGLVTLATGAVAFKQATPGAIALGPVLAGSIAQGSAIACFPLGATAGGIWYGLFPAQASPFLVAGATAGVLGVAAIATAFAGMVSDPVQKALGLHHRRLAALIDGLERAFTAGDARGFVAYDLYVARLMDLVRPAARPHPHLPDRLAPAGPGLAESSPLGAPLSRDPADRYFIASMTIKSSWPVHFVVSCVKISFDISCSDACVWLVND